MSTYSETFQDKVKQWLITKYEVIYTGNLDYKIETIPSSSLEHYTLSWGLNQETFPFVMQGQFQTEDDFYDYVVKQIAYTRFFETKRFIAYRPEPPDFIIPDFKDPLLTFNETTTNIC